MEEDDDNLCTESPLSWRPEGPAVLNIGVASLEETKARMLEAVNTGRFPGYLYAFRTFESLWKTVTPARMTILRALMDQGPMTAEAVSKATGRDLDSVQADLSSLHLIGLIDHVDAGFSFPFYDIHFDFLASKGEPGDDRAKERLLSPVPAE